MSLPTIVISELIVEIVLSSLAAGSVKADPWSACLQSLPTDLPFPNIRYSYGKTFIDSSSLVGRCVQTAL